jgi:hypothetical protein
MRSGKGIGLLFVGGLGVAALALLNRKPPTATTDELLGPAPDDATLNSTLDDILGKNPLDAITALYRAGDRVLVQLTGSTAKAPATITSADASKPGQWFVKFDSAGITQSVPESRLSRAA